MTRRGEFDLIAALFAPLAKGAPGAFDLTDDAACLDLEPSRELVVTADAVIGGVHFRMDDPPDLVARKALRVNLSDLAAKGARPRGFLQALMLNESVGDAYLEAYARGLTADVATFGIPLIGGDTTSGPGPFAVAVTALGDVPRGRALLRSGARAGDLLCVTGTIGDGTFGLACLDGRLTAPVADRDFLIGRYRLPTPRLGVGAALTGRAHACADISDGLIADVGHICRASRVGAVIARDDVPLSPAARGIIGREPSRWADVLGGGDDYELAFTLPEADAAALGEITVQTGVDITVIGRIVAREDVKLPPVAVVDAAGLPVAVPREGYRHR